MAEPAASAIALDHGVEQRPPPLEGAVGPRAPADGHERVGPAPDSERPVARLDVELDDPGQLLELDPLQRVDVRLGLAVGGHALGERPGGVEPRRGRAPRAAPDHLQQVAEQPRIGLSASSGFMAMHACYGRLDSRASGGHAVSGGRAPTASSPA